jgi:hypothetical protein
MPIQQFNFTIPGQDLPRIQNMMLERQQQQTQNALAQTQLAQAQNQLSDSQGVRSLMQRPDATLADYAKAGGMQGVQAFQGVQQAGVAADNAQRMRSYYGLTALQNAVDAAQRDPANAHAILGSVKQYAPLIGVDPNVDLSTIPPEQLAQVSATIAPRIKSARDALVPPEKQAEFEQQNNLEAFKQKNETGRTLITQSGENDRNRYTQGQENSRKAAEIAAANARSGFTSDGTLDPKFNSIVDAIGTYRAMPYNSMARSGPGPTIMAEVMRRYPGYDTTGYAGKVAAVKSFDAGKDSNTVDAINTAVSHLDQLKTLVPALNSGDVQLINQAKAAYQRATGQAAPTNAETVANIASAEINKVVTGGPGAEDDRNVARSMLNVIKQSPDQAAGAIDQLQGLMAGRLNSIALRYKQATKMDNFGDRLAPETKAALQRHAPVPVATGAVAPVSASDAALLAKYGIK